MKKLPIDGPIATLPVVDEDELNDWLATEVETGGYSASLNINWCGGRAKRITITLVYKTGDGTDQPYGDEPPDDAITADLEGAGWSVETEGIMLYGAFSPNARKTLVVRNWATKKRDARSAKAKFKMSEGRSGSTDTRSLI